MDGSYRDFLVERFGFSGWRSAERKTVISGVRLDTTELRGLRQVRVDRVSVPGARAAYQGMWASAANPETLVRVDVIEMPSVSSAREMTLSLLGEFQSPNLRRSERPIGDISFATPDMTSVVFAHQNVAAMLRNAGSEVISVRDIARDLDEALLKMES
jgi:hypothetical protein